ncbi:MAG: sugar phosphate isomerase/epimerase [Bryobacteraceae bacterium]|nr:sugar phosphate isomerase/epimerase [Bryobacteraceae bacterium]
MGGGAAALAATSVSLSPSMAAPGEASRPIRLGIASYSFREFSRRACIVMAKQLTPLLTIKEFHALYRSTPEELDRAKAEFQRAGIVLTGGGTVYMQKDDDADVKSYFEYAKRLGMPMMNVGPTAKTLPIIEKYAIQYDIKIAVHNHGPEDKHFPAPSDALKVIKNMDPRMGVCIDVGHTTRTGKDLIEEMKLAGPRMLDFHMKDLRNLMDKDSQCDVGDGAMPVKAIFAEMLRQNYKGIVHLEYEINAMDPMPGMIKSFAYMRGVIDGMAS